MAIWSPQLERGGNPRYLAIADAISRDIGLGILWPGSRLPPHRELAYRLGVTPGTIGRAYAEAERRGLVVGEVGRGTFVTGRLRDDPSTRDLVVRDKDSQPIVDLGLNLSPVGDSEKLLRKALGELTRHNDLSPLLAYQPAGGMREHRVSGADWVGRANIAAPAERVIVCNGAQHGLMVSLMTVAGAGDLVLSEALTYPGVKALAHQLNLQLYGLPMDGEGLRPDALEQICRTRSPRVLYCMPVLQNPTTLSMSEDRQRRIVEIARRHGIFIIEDDVYGFLVEDRGPPLAALAPDLTIYITSASKSMAPGLRVGYLLVPEALVEAASAVARLTDWMTAPLMAEIARRWILAGLADELVTWHRNQARARQNIVRRVLGGFTPDGPVKSYHTWLRLPEQWRMDALAADALRKGVKVITADAFAVRRDCAPHAVRLCVGAANELETIEEALHTLAALLHRTPPPPFDLV
jgi:DNA-binding transcriptional MocR family regulator